jgi:hypothetical protein
MGPPAVAPGAALSAPVNFWCSLYQQVINPACAAGELTIKASTKRLALYCVFSLVAIRFVAVGMIYSFREVNKSIRFDLYGRKLPIFVAVISP